MITHEVTVWCDEPECYEWIQSGDPLAVLRKSLRHAGWASSTDGDYCPEHARARGIKAVRRRRALPTITLAELARADNA